MTEWVTIRIKESVRKDAKADDRTYTEIMEAGLGNDTEGGIDDVIAEFNGPVQLSESERKAIAREVARQLDYAQLAGMVASDVVEELRE